MAVYMKKIALIALVLAMLCASAGAEPVLTRDNEPGSIDSPFKMNQTIVFSTEVYDDGMARTINDDSRYHSLELSVSVKNHLDPAYYQSKYSRTYSLKGNEACCVLEVALHSGGIDRLVLQNAVLIGLCDSDGNVFYGYQLIDSEIDGKTDVSVGTGETVRFYKRYDYPADGRPEFLFMTYYAGGISHTAYFSLDPVYSPLGKDMENDLQAVVKLQQKLIDMGYLDDAADGIFGNHTESAVKAAQKAFGMQETGIADEALQTRLFGK